MPLQQCGIEEAKNFQILLPQYHVHVLAKKYFNGIIYEGPVDGVPVYLYYHNIHFDVITWITGFLNKSHFCETY